MKKILSALFALLTIGMAFAQQNQSIVDSRTFKHADIISVINEGQPASITDFSSSNTSAKILYSKAIGTSANVYTVLFENASYLDANPETGTILFTHRQGGPWGGTSGNIRCKFSNNFGSTWDSIQFTATTPNLFRYPNGVIYNPPGNTNPTSAYAIVCGPTTDGTSWLNNYFCSQKLDGTGTNTQYFQIPPDSLIFAKSNLVSGGGRFHVLSTVSSITNESDVYYYQITNGTFNTGTNIVDWSKSYIHSLFKRRSFANGTTGWSANPNIAFAPDGLNGYFYTFAADTLVDPYNTSIPIIWKTSDGGVTWAKQSIYTGFDQIPAFRQQLFPTQETSTLPLSQQVFRPDFRSGTSLDESNFPGVVDTYGLLHFICVVEGKYSSHPDSLFYSYANHPRLMFDVFTNGISWNAIFIDTLNTHNVDAANSGFGTGTDALGWDHWIKMSKSPDGTKIFATWTDTDPTIDTTNILPEIHGWGLDIDANLMTLPKSFETGSGNIFYHQTSEIIFQNGSQYKIPNTYIDIYESGPSPLNQQKHYFLSGVEFNETDFLLQACYINVYIGQNTDICSGETVTLNSTVSGSNPPYTYQWNNGALVSSITVSPTSTTTYIVTITDINSCVGTAIINIGLYPPPTSFTVDTTMCNESVISISPGFNGATYLWSNQSTNSSIQIIENGTYTVTVTRCGLSAVDTFNVTAYNCLNSVTGTVFKDFNNNGIIDTGEPGIPNVVVKLTPGNLYYSTNYQGIFNAMTDTGNFIITLPYPPSNFTSSPSFQTAYFSNYAQTDIENNFAMFPIPEPDANIYVYANNARPGFDVYYYLNSYNQGNITLNGEIVFIKDSLLSYISGYPTPSYVSGDTIKWTYNNLLSGQNKNVQITTNLPATVALGTELQSVALISSFEGDSVPGNNVYLIEQIVTGSYDPNDKAMNPRILTPDYITEMKPLVYTIRFQNTGTDTAFTVKIRDTLCSNVNPASFAMVASSHPCTFQMYGHGIIEFTFANILLADSNTNEPQSHGYVMYKVLPKDSLEIGDTITNFADIYFDYNQPVRTNTVISPIVDTLLFKSNITFASNNNLKVFPNPFSGQIQIKYELQNSTDASIEIYNLLGAKIIDLQMGNQSAGLHILKTEKLKNLSKGAYIIKLKENNKSSYIRVIKSE